MKEAVQMREKKIAAQYEVDKETSHKTEMS